MKKNFLIVPMHCTPLVKAYMERNFGNPVVIPERHILNKLACAQLFKENNRWEGDYDLTEHTATFDFAISTKSFRFDGFNNNKVNMCNFNTAISDYIKVLCRTNLDTLLSLQDHHIDWRKRYLDLVNSKVDLSRRTRETDRIKKQLNKELGDHQFTIKKAIEYVVTVTLKLDFDILPFETVKKDYWRQRNKPEIIKI